MFQKWLQQATNVSAMPVDDAERAVEDIKYAQVSCMHRYVPGALYANSLAKTLNPVVLATAWAQLYGSHLARSLRWWRELDA